MHSLMMDSLTPILAQNIFVSIWSTLWPYFAMLGGFSVIVFVHELGHFAVAKWADVRVEKFAIGFGRELFGFTRGETRYSFNMLPLGGYVKMLGQEDFDDKAKELMFNDDPRSFVNKPVSHRMAIVSAGVIMNILFACFLFMIVFMIGMEAVAPRIARVEPDSPAEKAGLLPGDIIREINGERILEFNEILFAVLLATPHEPIEFVVERNGEILPPIRMTPEYRMPTSKNDIQRQIVGISSGVTPTIIAIGPQIDSTKPDQPHLYDVLVEVGGIEVTQDNVSEVYAMLAYNSSDIIVLRSDKNLPDEEPKRVRVTIPPLFSLYPSNMLDPGTVSVLGLTPLVRIRGSSNGGRGYLGGLEAGDTILSWNDQPYPKGVDIIRSVRNNPERDISYRVQKSDGRIVQDFVRPKSNRKGAGTIQAVAQAINNNDDEEDTPRAFFTEILAGGIADNAGIEVGDVILDIHQNHYPTMIQVERVIQNNRNKEIRITVEKPDGQKFQKRLVPIPSGVINTGMDLLAEDIMVIGHIVEEINGRPSPAAESGIPPGVRLLSVNDTSISRWQELIDVFSNHAGRSVRIAYLDHSGQTKNVSFSIPHSLRTILGVGTEARIVRIDGKDEVKVRVGSMTEVVSIQYHEGIRQKLKKLVNQKKVPVEYRENSLGELKTAYVDITEDMVDPWLGRINYSPNILLAEERILLKGEGALDAVSIGIHKTYYFIFQVYRFLERLIFTRSVSVESVSGPLGIIDMGGQIAKTGLVKFLFFLAIISANLAVINFLPFPIVDGGLMVFLIIEKIKGSPVSLKVQVATQMIGLFFIIGFFIFVTYQDVLRMTG